jgi:hypothetical protein
MRVVFFSSQTYDRSSFAEANRNHGHDLVFLEPRLSAATSSLAAGFPGVCIFVNEPSRLGRRGESGSPGIGADRAAIGGVQPRRPGRD